MNGDFSWEMIGLGLEEPLPSQDVIDELCVSCSLMLAVWFDLIDSDLDNKYSLRRYIPQCPSYISPDTSQR
jgi:hypothetical protein